MAVDNPLFQWWADHAFENAYSQEEFESGIAQYAEFINSQTPDLQQERANLGDNADARIEAVEQKMWVDLIFQGFKLRFDALFFKLLRFDGRLFPLLKKENSFGNRH